MKHKFTFYSIFVLALLLGLAAIGLRFFKFTVWVEPPLPDTASLPEINSPDEPAVEQGKTRSAASSGASLSPTPTVTPPQHTPATSPSKNLDPAAVAAHQGALRVSNPTQHPVRLALLARQTKKNTYGEPAHWDFAPMEGGTQGLMLSLPQENLKLKKGDILVAFAQDGSRQYWGPYVVGETPIPVWNPQKGEWQLILQP